MFFYLYSNIILDFDVLKYFIQYFTYFKKLFLEAVHNFAVTYF